MTPQTKEDAKVDQKEAARNAIQNGNAVDRRMPDPRLGRAKPRKSHSRAEQDREDHLADRGHHVILDSGPIIC